MRLVTKLLPPTCKVFCDEEPVSTTAPCLSGFQNEKISFQVACAVLDTERREHELIEVKAIGQLPVHIRQVMDVPVHMGTSLDDGDYLRNGRPGLYPDILQELPERGLRVRLWKAFWVDVEPKGAQPGKYDLTIRILREGTDEVLGEESVKVEVLPGELPKQKLIHTKWMQTDCLSS